MYNLNYDILPVVRNGVGNMKTVHIVIPGIKQFITGMISIL